MLVRRADGMLENPSLRVMLDSRGGPVTLRRAAASGSDTRRPEQPASPKRHALRGLPR